MTNGGALAMVLLCLIGAFIGGAGKDGKPRSMGIAVISSVIGAISILIAFPDLLSIGGPVVVIWVPLVTGLIGVIICLLASKGKNLTGLILFLGVTLVAWALFRWLPAGPAAFQFLGEHVSNAGKELGTGIAGWWDRITSDTAPLPEK